MTRWMLLPFVLVAAGCSSYRPAGEGPAPASAVRVSFLSPRDVVGRTPAGDSVRVAEVRQVEGTLISARTDSLHIRIGTLSGLSGRLAGVPTGTVMAVPRGASVRVETRGLDGGRMAGSTALVLIGVAAAIGIVLSVLLRKAGDDLFPW